MDKVTEEVNTANFLTLYEFKSTFTLFLPMFLVCLAYRFSLRCIIPMTAAFLEQNEGCLGGLFGLVSGWGSCFFCSCLSRNLKVKQTIKERRGSEKSHRFGTVHDCSRQGT